MTGWRDGFFRKNLDFSGIFRYTERKRKRGMEMKDLDLVVLGELLIDFTPVGISEKGNPIFERNPGGGPANMACAAAKMGVKAAFVGKVGDDPFGRALQKTLEDHGVNTGSLLLSQEYPTTLAFVHLDEKGDRSFSFYRKGGADTMLRWDEIDSEILGRCKYFFCSSVMMADGPSRETSFQMMKEAKKRQVPVIFDPNLRPNLWKDSGEMVEVVRKAMPFADILKVSEEEALILTGESDLEKAVEFLRREYAPEILLLTLGADGAVAYAGEMRVNRPAFPVKTVDTTAAGDSFTGGFTAGLLETGKKPSELTQEELSRIVRLASAVGGLTTTRKGSISALPSREEVENLLHSSL